MKKIIALILAIGILCCGCTAKEKIVDNSKSEVAVSSQPINEDLLKMIEQKDYKSLYEIYLNSAANSTVISQSWTSAEELQSEAFLEFYYFQVLLKDYPNGWDSPLQIASDKLENYIVGFFDVPVEHIRKASKYNSEKSIYEFDYGVGAGGAIVQNAVLKDNILQLSYAFPSRADETKFTSYGTIDIAIAGNQFKYLKCVHTEN